MSDLISRIKDSGISRRDFVAATAASAAVLTLAGCDQKLGSTEDVTNDGQQAVMNRLEGGGWVQAPCFLQCGQKCINAAYVVDGIPIRQKTDDRHPDTPDYPQQRGCLKGRSHRQAILGADRLKYPMKRKSWQPGGGDNANAELRGKDEWERLSWDEALNIVADEFKRIKETYGNKSFLGPQLVSNRASGMYSSILLNAYGGCTTIWGQQSKGGLPLVVSTITNGYCAGAGDRISLRKAKLIVLWGWNSIFSISGSHTVYLRHAKDAGAKIIVVDPWFSPTAQGLADDWIPCRPGTDGALLCAVAYHMIENNLQDQAYLDKYCVGFDSGHMPAGEEGSESFKDYILGASDGIPKTPEWASEICGTDPAAIRSLAEQMATAKPMSLKASGAPSRVYNGQQFTQLFYTVCWMTGNVGVVGSGVTAGVGNTCINNGPSIVSLGSSGIFKAPANPVCTQPRGEGKLELGEFNPNQYYGIPYAEVWEAILTGKHHHFLDGEVECNIKCIFKTEACEPLNQLINAKRGVEAMRTPGKLDFVVSVDFFLTTTTLFADIVLPATTPWENEGGYAAAMNREAVLIANKVIEPYFESKPDWWIDKELARRLGIDESLVVPPDPTIDYAMMVAKGTVVDKEGKKQNLAAVTAEDIADLKLTVEPQDGLVPIKELFASGGYQVERFEGDGFDYTVYADFYKDPEANPAPTATGKFEIFSRALADRAANFRTTVLEPIGKYVPAKEGYEDSFSDWKTKTKGEYPFQLITLHLMRQAHSMYFNVKSLNELFSNAAVINDLDAAALGLKTNDTALITSMHGQVLRRVEVTSRIMPGVVIMGQGAWITLDEQTGIDRAGNVNYLTGGILTGAGESPYNTVLLKIEKYTGTPLEPDYMVPQRILNV
jgi:anaerobic dimethyl sulfoxide reductase subunit A